MQSFVGDGVRPVLRRKIKSNRMRWLQQRRPREWPVSVKAVHSRGTLGTGGQPFGWCELLVGCAGWPPVGRDYCGAMVNGSLPGGSRNKAHLGNGLHCPAGRLRPTALCRRSRLSRALSALFGCMTSCWACCGATSKARNGFTAKNTYVSTQVCDAKHRTVAAVRGTVTLEKWNGGCAPSAR